MKRIIAALLAGWTLTAIAATVNLVWDASAGATGYTLGYGTAPGSRSTLQEVGAPTTGIVNGLVAGTTYYFAVRGHNATQQSPFGNEVPVTVLGTPPPINQPPTVSLVAAPTTCVVPCSSQLTATANDSDGTIASVALSGDGTITTAPYVFTVPVTVAGSTSYTATALDNLNASGVSNTVTVTGTNPPPPGGSPVFVLEAETAWNTTTNKTTAAFNVQSGDLLVAIGINEGLTSALGVSGGSQTWANRQRVAVSQYAEVDIWTTVATTAKSMTATFSGSGAYFGGNVLVFRNAAVGASAKANGTGTPSVNLTTTQPNSLIVVVNGDWLAIDGAARVYRTNAGPVTQQTYAREAARYTVYIGFHPNAGPTGTYSLGLNAPGGQKYSIVAIEIKGQ